MRVSPSLHGHSLAHIPGVIRGSTMIRPLSGLCTFHGQEERAGDIHVSNFQSLLGVGATDFHTQGQAEFLETRVVPQSVLI